jgi:hypothetical protein
MRKLLVEWYAFFIKKKHFYLICYLASISLKNMLLIYKANQNYSNFQKVFKQLGKNPFFFPPHYIKGELVLQK